jgi:hypothetical protein
MKKQIVLLISCVTILASSCKVAGTLYPLSLNENDFIFKKEMIGKWGDSKDSSGHYSVDTVSGNGGKLYEIEIVSYNKEKNTTDTARLNAHLVNINGWLYLDSWLIIKNELNAIDKNYEDWLIARHFIIRLSFPEVNVLEMAAPDTEELIKLIDQKKILLHYANLKKDDYLILDKPAVLQKGLAQSKKYPMLFKDKNVLYRLE